MLLPKHDPHYTKNEVFHRDFFSKYDQIRSFLRIWLHLPQKYLMENFIFSAVLRAAKDQKDLKIYQN